MNLTRMLGLAVLAVLALSAFGASTASAAEFKGEGKDAIFYGVQAAGQSNEWKIDGSNKTFCKKASYKSKLTILPTKTVLLEPTFEECSALEYSEKNSTLEMGGCKFELLQPNVSMESNVAIRCPAGESIRFFGSGVGECEALIGEAGNTNLGKASYKNIASSPTKWEVSLTLIGITVDKKKDGFFCNLNGTGVVTNGVFNATVTIGDENGTNISIS